MKRYDPVRIVVIGVGGFGVLHARTLAGIAEAELVGVVDVNSEAITALRKDLPEIRAWGSVEAAIRESDAEAYIIATQTQTHVSIAELVLRTTRHVLIEKPLAGEAAEAQRLSEWVKPDSSNLMMGHILLFAPQLRRLLREIAQRPPITFMQAVRHRPVSKREYYPKDNPIRLTMVHDLYVAQAIVNGQEPSEFASWMHPHRDGGSDAATAELRWSNGMCASFAATFLTPPGMPADGFDRLEIFADGWSAKLALNPQPLEIWTDRAAWPVGLDIHEDPVAPSGWLAEELRHFCRVVRGQATVPVGARYQDAVQIQQWIQTLETLARKGGRDVG